MRHPRALPTLAMHHSQLPPVYWDRLLALTPQGLRDILDAREAAEAPVWCSADALSEAEFGKLERGNITSFTYSFADADTATIQNALATIEEHHPGERVWIESAAFRI